MFLYTFFTNTVYFCFLTDTNPCTKSFVSQGILYHPYPGRPELYIQCTSYGASFTRRCSAGQFWDTRENTCSNPELISQHGGVKTQPSAPVRQLKSSHRQYRAPKARSTVHKYSYVPAAHKSTGEKSVKSSKPSGLSSFLYGPRTVIPHYSRPLHQSNYPTIYKSQAPSAVKNSANQGAYKSRNSVQPTPDYKSTHSSYHSRKSVHRLPTPYKSSPAKSVKTIKSPAIYQPAHHSSQLSSNQYKSQQSSRHYKSEHVNKVQPVNHYNSGPIKSVAPSKHYKSESTKSVAPSKHYKSEPVKSVAPTKSTSGKKSYNHQPHPNSKLFVPKIELPSAPELEPVSDHAAVEQYNSADAYSRSDKSEPYSSTYTRQRQDNQYMEASLLKEITEPDLSYELNPCTHPEIQYVSHPADLNRYIECIDGIANQRHCIEGEVWIQPLRRCQNAQERLGDAQLPNEACVEATTRYNPDPHSSRRYIECLSWYNTKTHLCPQGYLWMQSEQQCMSESVRYPVRTVIRHHSQSGQSDHTTGDNGVYDANMCTNQDGFYHPYPHDPSRFIQCDQFGNLYVRECGLDRLWSDEEVTCVSQNNIVYTGEGANYDQGANYGDSVNYGDGGNYGNPYEADTINQYDVTLDDPTRNYGPNCASGDIWDATLERCVPYGGHSEPSLLLRGTVSMKYVGKELPSSSQLTVENINQYEYNTTETTTIINGEKVVIEERVYDGTNPCKEQDEVTSDTYYYHQFPLDASFFIQCDQLGNMFIQACGDDKVWSPKVQTCVPGQEPASRDLKAPDAKSIPTLSISNPCLEDEAAVYNSHPFDENMFVVCVGETPYTFHCPEGQTWDHYSLTCHWPGGYGDNEAQYYMDNTEY